MKHSVRRVPGRTSILDMLRSYSSYLRDSNSDRILSDVESWARSRPWVAAAAGALVGFAASRFLKASSRRRYEQLSSSNGGSLGASGMYRTRELSTGTPPGAM